MSVQDLRCGERSKSFFKVKMELYGCVPMELLRWTRAGYEHWAIAVGDLIYEVYAEGLKSNGQPIQINRKENYSQLLCKRAPDRRDHISSITLRNGITADIIHSTMSELCEEFHDVGTYNVGFHDCQQFCLFVFASFKQKGFCGGSFPIETNIVSALRAIIDSC